MLQIIDTTCIGNSKYNFFMGMLWIKSTHFIFYILFRTQFKFSRLFHPDALFEYASRILMKTIRWSTNSWRDLLGNVCISSYFYIHLVFWWYLRRLINAPKIKFMVITTSEKFFYFKEIWMHKLYHWKWKFNCLPWILNVLFWITILKIFRNDLWGSELKIRKPL